MTMEGHLNNNIQLTLYSGVHWPPFFIPNEKRLQELQCAKVYDDDVWIVSYPKSGKSDDDFWYTVDYAFKL